MIRITTILLTLTILAACGPRPDPAPLLERAAKAIDPDGKLTGTIYLRQEGEFEPSGNVVAKVPYLSETLLVLPDRMVTRTSVAGVVTVKCVDGEKAWIRAGAAVNDQAGPAATEQRADADDLLALLVRPLTSGPFEFSRSDFSLEIVRPGGPERTVEFDPAEGLPSRLVRETRNSRGETGELVRAFSDWKVFGPIRFPANVVVSMGGSRLRLVTKTLEFEPVETRGLSTARPRDEAGYETGPIRRVPEPGGNYLLVRQRGTYLDLARGDVLLKNGCEQAFATALGPIRRTFQDLPGKNRSAFVTSLLPVRFERVEETRRVPKGVEIIRLSEVDTLAMKVTGPYPRDRSLENTLVNYGQDLGLEAAGPARYLILSNPDVGDPADLSMEIRMPVRPRPEGERK